MAPKRIRPDLVPCATLQSLAQNAGLLFFTAKQTRFHCFHSVYPICPQPVLLYADKLAETDNVISRGYEITNSIVVQSRLAIFLSGI